MRSNVLRIDPGPVAAPIRLDMNEAPTPSVAVRDVVHRAIGAVALERYPDARATELKRAVARRTGAHPEALLVGAGAEDVLALASTAVAHEWPGAVFLSVSPTFVMYRALTTTRGLRCEQVALDGNFDLDVPEMLRAIRAHRPRIVAIASPNNPTGNLMSEDRLEEICAAAPGALVIVDEAYVAYARRPSLRGWRERFTNVAVLSSLSKVGLAALRVGWLEAGEEWLGRIDKVRPPFNVAATSQAAAVAVLSDAWDDVMASVARVVSERERVARSLASMKGVRVAPSDANFLWVECEAGSEHVADELRTRGVIVRRAGGPGAKSLRMTVGATADNDYLLEALSSIRTWA